MAHWLIVEDALRGDAGHWRDYLRVFRAGLAAAGDTAALLCARGADAAVVSELDARPCLPSFAWESRRRGPLTRAIEAARHLAGTWGAVAAACREREPDVIYVPTVKPVHLVTWTQLARTGLAPRARIVLLFMNGLAQVDSPDEEPRVPDTRAARAMRRLLDRAAGAVRAGRLLPASDTPSLAREYAGWSGLPFLDVPQPVAAPERSRPARTPGPVVFGAFGDGRHEKGTDLLQEAMRRMASCTEPHRFVVQWITPFTDPGGATHAADPSLEGDGRVRFLRGFLGPAEYARHLEGVDVLVLPYRRSSYARRGSRVVIEAAVNGIPVVVTARTALADVASAHGAGVLFRDGDVADLVRALGDAARDLDALGRRARDNAPAARAHYSVAEFRRRIGLEGRPVGST